MNSSLRNHLLRLLVILLVAAASLGGHPARAQSGIDAVIHYVEGAPSETSIAYEVTAYVSVTDSTGNPVKDLLPTDFTVTEDSQTVNVLSADLATSAPINLVLLLDTSGSMAGAGITAAREAAANFVAGLGPEDRVAVVRFDDTVQPLIHFTSDHKAARDEISLIEATRGAGTCLYDAAFQAVQMTATVPSGRRAVVLFTDGVDEAAGGGTCSVHDAGSVIDLATDPGTRTPVYTLGMGKKVDGKSLQLLAQDTGGRYLYSTDPSQLSTVFYRLADSLRSQYAVKYSSAAGPGPHTLAVTARYLGAQDTDTRAFLLPVFPLRLSFVQPAAGQAVSGKTTLKVEPFGGGETIEAVLFLVNGTVVATVKTSPYEAQVDFGAYAAGSLTLEAVAQGAGGIELARVPQTVIVAVGTATVPVTVTPTPGGSIKEEDSALLGFAIGGVVLLGLALVVVLIVMAVARQRRERERNLEWDQKVGGIGEPTLDPLPSPPTSDRTMDAFDMSPDAFGRLTVTASDDASMLGQHFEITSPRTTLGRKADNDVIFPKDTPVSRHHAVIEARSGDLLLSEVSDFDEKTGQPKRPTYGTFVNEREVGGRVVPLQDGDEIRLGKRVRLKFEMGANLRLGNETTVDGLDSPGDWEKTMEA